MDWHLLFHFELQCHCAANCSTAILSPLAGSSVCAGPTNVTASFRYSAPNAQSTAYSAVIAGSSVVCTASGECMHTYPASCLYTRSQRSLAQCSPPIHLSCPVCTYVCPINICRLASTEYIGATASCSKRCVQAEAALSGSTSCFYCACW